MIIDFHTHIFPERIAARTIEVLKEGIRRLQGVEFPAYTDATAAGLRRSMSECGVDLSVVMPIATKPSQTDTINDYAEGVRGDGLLSFGSVHPENGDIEGILCSLAERGFPGIKLHPEFQQFYIDSPQGLRILKAAEKYGLLVTLHAGADVGWPPPVHCTPERLRNALGEVKGDNIIAAHMGGFRMWEDVAKYLVGTPVYFDTAVVGPFIDKAVYKDLILAHGADKVLFASDSPWEHQGEALSTLSALGLDAADLEKITCSNAMALLDITDVK